MKLENLENYWNTSTHEKETLALARSFMPKFLAFVKAYDIYNNAINDHDSVDVYELHKEVEKTRKELEK